MDFSALIATEYTRLQGKELITCLTASYLREVAKLVYEADRHAKEELKKQVCGIRLIERGVKVSSFLSPAEP